MNKLPTAQAAKLTNALLATDEEEYDRIAREIVHACDKATDLESVDLEVLDIPPQTIPFLYTLVAHIEYAIKNSKSSTRELPATLLPEGQLWPAISAIIIRFDPIQARYAGGLLLRVVEIVAKGGEQAGNPVPAIQLLQHVIITLDSSSSTLTTTHFQYLQLCLLAQAYTEGATLLDLPIYSVPSQEAAKSTGNRAYKQLCSVHESSSVYLTQSTGLTGRINSRMYLEYFLMGALCYIGTEQYRKAIAFLEIVLATPTMQNATSKVQLDAYKKWVLLNLIVNGYSTDLPKSVSQATARNLRHLGKPYDSIVDGFKSFKADRLQAEIQEGIEVWQTDGNYGLMHEVFAAFRKFMVSRLAKTYTALSIEEVTRLTSAGSLNVTATVSYLQDVIEHGELKAQLIPSATGGAGVLRFLPESSGQLSEAEVEAQMMLKSRELNSLLKQISDIDHQMVISRDYIDYLHKLKNARDKEKKSSAPRNQVPVPDMHDEDMMDDI